MSEILSINIHQARTQPEFVFETPETFEIDTALTRGQKIATLGRWAADVEARLTAASEGMVGARGCQTNDAQILTRIGNARRRLVEVNRDEPNPGFLPCQ